MDLCLRLIIANIYTMKNNLLVIILVATSISGFCQRKKYENAFIVSLNSDTIPGLILKKNKISLCKEIIFKESLIQDSTVQYEPTDIYSFCFLDKNKIYKSIAYKNSDKISMHGFGELLLADEINLYKLYLPSYEVNENNIVYIIETDTANYTLQQSQSILKKQEHAFFHNQGFEYSRSYNTVRKKYIGTLKYAFKDCPEIREAIAKVNFNDREIIGIVRKYILCKKEKQ